LTRVDPGSALKGTLRPYQEVGVQWLYLLAKLGLGACLADDMGLGKTIQVLALLLILRQQSDGIRRRSLLVAPASLLANWAAELERFAPSLSAIVAHPSEMSANDLKSMTPDQVRTVDLVITSYGSLLRLPWIADVSWNLLVLDEAQAIKNPAAKQTQAVKKLNAAVRFALTGTPIENRLGDLWSIFIHQSRPAGIGKGIHAYPLRSRESQRSLRGVPDDRLPSEFEFEFLHPYFSP